MKKTELRTMVQKHRDRLSESERMLEDRKIQISLLELLKDVVGPVHCYLSFRNEVNTIDLLKRLWSLGQIVMCPRVVGNGELKHYWVKDWSQLEKNSWGILEPKVSCCEADPDLAVLVIVPGLAFSKSGTRLGYGKGFYDRFLNHSKALKVGIAYACQILPELPTEEHDVSMNILITGEGIWKVSP